MKKVFCRSIDEMYAAFNTYQGQIWGFVLYAHGSKTGDIAESNGKKTTQTKLMSSVDKQGYKLAKVYLMQCYSGRNKDLEIRYTYEELWNFYLDNQERYQKDIEYWRSRTRAEFMKAHFDRYKEIYTTRGEGLTYKNGSWNENEIYFLLESQWGIVWGKRTVKGKPDISYQGVNGLGIDWGFWENNKKNRTNLDKSVSGGILHP